MPSDDMQANPFDLKALIAAENNPERRVLLMLVNNFNESLVANTIAVQANAKEVKGIAERLDGHLATFEDRAKKDDELRNKGKGAWAVLAWVLGVAQAAVGYGLIATRSDMKEVHTAIVASQKADATIEGRLTAIEATTRTNRP